jgi:hypothetical protein
LPLIQEVLEQPPEAGYLDYLEHKLRPLAEAKQECNVSLMCINRESVAQGDGRAPCSGDR